MARRARLYLVGFAALVTLAGCGRGFFQMAEREPWRREAEIACLKSGAVKEGAGLVRIEPIEGPGICGAEYPLKVAALGGTTALGFAGDMRPPASVPGGASNMPPVMGAPPTTLSAQRDALRWSGSAGVERQPIDDSVPPRSGAPTSLYAPGVTAPPPDAEISDAAHDVADDEEPADRRAPAPPAQSYPAQQRPLPSLGPARGQVAAIGPVEIKPSATLACPIVSAIDRWINDAIQPAALRWFGSPVAEIRQISAYSCRGMNGNPRARISEHAFGNALDIASFTLADGRKITVKGGWKGLPEEQGFLRDVQGAACRQFTTVLAPGSNVYHYDHIHIDLMRRSSGRSICNPDAVSGEVVAARAAGGHYAGRDNGRGGGITGSISSLIKRSVRSSPGSDDDTIEDESNIRE